ncbi:ABC transporter substrate-binding protein [Meridianimarinicoccus sp. RP-17]|uniref:ABC transporter substrate-binding protein n=1 Tax=Meridianimarinicoccus zhengii TaxID=2056810 RepID=UPI000DADE647|nr:ABC transporter substrate-binding protein [Phycocomes zhengii]
MIRILFCAAVAVAALPASAETFRWASTTDPQSMDPHSTSSTPVLGFLNNVYEGLVRRGPDMAIEPSLATAWEPIDGGAGWRFTLREGVTFHDGAAFTAEDVLFSYDRAASEASDVRSWFAPVSEVVVVDDYTVEIMTTSPQPLFPDSIANWMIMDADWAQANGAELPARDTENFATRNANGTGAFRLVDRQPDLQTVLEPFDGWWGDAADHGITQAVFTPIQNSATAVAALLSGEVDMIEPVPVQDADRVDANDGTRVVRGIESRVIMLGFPHDHDTLRSGAENPFTDVRVRRAVAHAINVPAILQTIMRGSAEPAAQLVAAGTSGYSQPHDARPAYDPEAARALLAEAGYPDGFAFDLSCTNDRYLNDESVCQAIVGMLAQVGLEVTLDAMPVSNYWPELREDNFDMFLLGWSPGTFDAEHPIRFLVHTAGDRLGTWNFGGYSSARIDELLPVMQSEIDPTVRQAAMEEAAGIIQDDMVYVPLYVQPLLWGVREGVEVTQRSDNFLILRWVRMN